MASKAIEQNSYLRRPLYVYDLPLELLDSLSLRTTGNNVPELRQEQQDVAKTSPVESIAGDVNGSTKSITCTLCKTSFQNVSEQRQHVKSDFHRYNLKLSLKGLTAIDEQTFIKQIGDLDESISGSESSASDSSDEESSSHPKDSTLSALLKKQAKISARQDGEDGEFSTSRKEKKLDGAPLLWLSSPKTGEDVGLGLYRAIFSNSEQQNVHTDLVEILRKKQISPVASKQSGHGKETNSGPNASDPHFFLCMIGGGHFAAAIIGLAPELRKGPGGIEERHAIVKAHKTFHRYTTRRKQGGSQSANDNAKGNAHSAGSSIRRYNEVALETDVRNILKEWKSMIDSSELIFIRASGTTGRRTLFGPYEEQILNKTDPRIRGFPFSTRRATQNELLRSFQELTRVKVSTFVVKEEERTVEAKPKLAKNKIVQPERSKEEEAALLHTSQLQNLIRRTKAPALLLYITKNELSPDIEFFPAAEYHHAPRPLHLSASINSPALVTALLTKAKADPTLTNADGKTAYDIAGDTKTRDAFRTARYQLGENAWDWAAAHVPAAISPEDAEAKAKQEKVAADAVEAERRRAGLEQIERREEQQRANHMERKAGVGKSLSATVEKTGSEKREEEMRGLTPEMRQKLERERRARAAEARLKAMSGNK